MLEGLRKALALFSERISTSDVLDNKTEREIDNLKLQLVENDVSVEVSEKIIEEMKKELEGVRVKRFSSPRNHLRGTLRKVLEEIIPESSPRETFLELLNRKRSSGEPLVVLFVGPNGGGKTTTVVKVGRYLTKLGARVLIACSDTYRAGAIEQLKQLSDRAGIRAVSHKYGGDPASVAFDAILSAKAGSSDVVLIDTAGRTEIDKNLLEEMKKIKRVTSPDLLVYVGDSLTGNVALEQARQFDSHVGIDSIILTKIDADVKGGSAVSISYATRKPIIFLGTGQNLDDLLEFRRDEFLTSLTS